MIFLDQATGGVEESGRGSNSPNCPVTAIRPEKVKDEIGKEEKGNDGRNDAGQMRRDLSNCRTIRICLLVIISVQRK